MLTNARTVSLFFCITFCLTFSKKVNAQINTVNKEYARLIIGKWKFVKFDWPNYVSSTAAIRKESESQFKDAVYQFNTDNRLVITQAFKPKGYSQNLVYNVKGDKIYVLSSTGKKANPQILEIDRLDSDQFVFYVQGSNPIGTFQRVK